MKKKKISPTATILLSSSITNSVSISPLYIYKFYFTSIPLSLKHFNTVCLFLCYIFKYQCLFHLSATYKPGREPWAWTLKHMTPEKLGLWKNQDLRKSGHWKTETWKNVDLDKYRTYKIYLILESFMPF